MVGQVRVDVCLVRGAGPGSKFRMSSQLGSEADTFRKEKEEPIPFIAPACGGGPRVAQNSNPRRASEIHHSTLDARGPSEGSRLQEGAGFATKTWPSRWLTRRQHGF